MALNIDMLSIANKPIMLSVMLNVVMLTVIYTECRGAKLPSIPLGANVEETYE
jgi:hypothetical protein